MKRMVVSLLLILVIFAGCSNIGAWLHPANTLKDVAEKGGGYSSADCVLLLETQLDEIAKAFNLDLSSEPSGGLLLDGYTFATPIIFFNENMALTSFYEIDSTDLPLGLLLFGPQNEATPVEGLVFGMASESVDTMRFDLCDSFTKISEVAPEEATKIIETTSGKIVYKSVFLEENDAFILNYMHVYLVQN